MELERLDARYALQAGWSRQLRQYIFRKLSGCGKLSVLEVGCSTGAVMRCLRAEFPGQISRLVGIDIDRDALACAASRSDEIFCAGNGMALPFPDRCFDLVYCHYLLLWVSEPETLLREMRRVTKPGGVCAALAEPCYAEMEAAPDALFELADRQRHSLVKRGADPESGRNLGRLFRKAGFSGMEFGRYEKGELSPEFLRQEIAQMMEDTGTAVFDIRMDEKCGYYVPTYFVIAEK